jgi:hypothetical protein
MSYIDTLALTGREVTQLQSSYVNYENCCQSQTEVLFKVDVYLYYVIYYIFLGCLPTFNFLVCKVERNKKLTVSEK